MHSPETKNVASSLTANGHYFDFQALERRERKGVDYTIHYRRRDSFWAVMAIHGGRIEPGTSAIADDIAGNDFSFYTFSGLKPRHNNTLHIPSHRFTEPTALTIAANAQMVLSVHGCRGQEPTVYIGGRAAWAKNLLSEAIRGKGFKTVLTSQKELRGLDKDNICNRGGKNHGIQLEITAGLRAVLFTHHRSSTDRSKTPHFHRFSFTINRILKHLATVPDLC